MPFHIRHSDIRICVPAWSPCLSQLNTVTNALRLASLTHFEMHSLHTGLSQFDTLCENPNTRREGTWARDNKKRCPTITCFRKESPKPRKTSLLHWLPFSCFTRYFINFLCCFVVVVLYFRKLQQFNLDKQQVF